MNDNFVRTGVVVSYGANGHMNATYDAGEGEPKGRGRVNGYNRPLAEAAAEAAAAAVLDWWRKTRLASSSVDGRRDEPDWANADNCVVGRIGRNKFAVVFTGTSA